MKCIEAFNVSYSIRGSILGNSRVAWWAEVLMPRAAAPRILCFRGAAPTQPSRRALLIGHHHAIDNMDHAVVGDDIDCGNTGVVYFDAAHGTHGE